MDAMWIEELAEAMIDVFVPEYGYDASDINITQTGARIGETFDEKILTKREVLRTVENESLYAILPEQSHDNGYLSHDGLDGFEPVEDVIRSSENAEKLTRDEIVKLLRTEFTEGIAV